MNLMDCPIAGGKLYDIILSSAMVMEIGANILFAKSLMPYSILSKPAANISDTVMGGYTIESMIMKHPTIEAVSADAGYRETTVDYSEILLNTPVHI